MLGKSPLLRRTALPTAGAPRGRVAATLGRCGIGLLCGIWLAAGATAQTLYKSVGPDGRVSYSDRPPERGQVVKTLTPATAPSSELPVSAVEQLRRLRATAPAAAAPATGGVVLYSAEWCSYCKKAKAYLAGKGIAYREVDIDTPDGLAAFARAGGGKGVPLLVAGGRQVGGFSPGAYDQFFASRR